MSSKVVDWSSPATLVWLPLGMTPASVEMLLHLAGVEKERHGSLYEASFLIKQDIEGRGARSGMVPWIVTEQNLMFAPGDIRALIEARSMGGANGRH